MTIETKHYKLDVEGLQFNTHPFHATTLEGFESVTINDVIIVTYDELMELSLPYVSEIWQALKWEANKQAESFSRN